VIVWLEPIVCAWAGVTNTPKHIPNDKNNDKIVFFI
jgi:hypothetical protein